jgi:hypothetical protein
MQNVHGCQETNEPEKLYYETQKDNGDGSRGNKEGTARKRRHLEEREEEDLEHTGTIRDDEQKPNAASTIEEETEAHQQRNQIQKLKKKKKLRAYYHKKQIEINKRPRLDKHLNMLKIKAIMQTANKTMEDILDGKDLYITELNHLIYEAATVIVEEIN